MHNLSSIDLSPKSTNQNPTPMFHLDKNQRDAKNIIMRRIKPRIPRIKRHAIGKKFKLDKNRQNTKLAKLFEIMCKLYEKQKVKSLLFKQTE